MAIGNREQGFTYLAALLLVAVSGISLAAFAGAWSHAREREKQAELRWVGGQFRQAIGLYYERSPGGMKRYPERLEDLIEDKRFLTVQRYLRRVHADPLTGRKDWELVPAPGGGFMGVRSPAQRSEWSFSYEPLSSRGR
jgi:type II secretory pathway pseudopilin PulG